MGTRIRVISSFCIRVIVTGLSAGLQLLREKRKRGAKMQSFCDLHMEPQH